MKNWAAGLAVLTGLLGVMGGAVAYAGSIESDPIDSHSYPIDSTGKERAMGICFAVDHGEMLSPEGIAKSYFWNYENNKEVALPSPSDAELVVQPKHGKVDYVKMQDGLLYARYLADAGYLGDDKLVFKVKVDGKIVRVHYLLKVTDKGADNGEVQDLLCKETGDRWKISLPIAPVDNLATVNQRQINGVRLD